MGMTPEERLEFLWEQFVEQTEGGDPEYATRLFVERDGLTLAVTFALEPPDVKFTVPLALAAFRADTAVFASDAWLVMAPKDTTEEQMNAFLDRYGSIRGAFEAGHPWASEGFQMAIYNRDGSSLQGHITYDRRSTHLKRKDTGFLSGRAVGRSVPEAAVLERVPPAIEMIERVGSRMGVATLGADMAAVRTLERFTGQKWALLVAYEQSEADEAMQAIKDIAKDMGYGDDFDIL